VLRRVKHTNLGRVYIVRDGDHMNFFRSLPIAAVLLCAPASSMAGVFISINIAPPVLPVYVQPPCPTDGYLWTPGYWAYAPAGYYWVPGTWVPAPQPGFLWTPGYWGFANGLYGWHAGYWGLHVGFYGGVNYGYGYGGVGFFGGRWDGGHFMYNTAVMRVNTTVIHNVYNQTVVNNVNNRASFNGPGGVVARPNAAEEAAAHEQHVAATSSQMEHERSAAANRANFVSENHGHPAMAAVARPMAAAAAGHAMAARPQTAVSRPVSTARPPTQMSRPASAARPQTQAARPASSYHPAPAAAPRENVRSAAPAREAAPARAPAHAPAVRQEKAPARPAEKK